MVAQSCPWAMHKSGPDNTNMCFYQDGKGGTSLSHFYRRWQEASRWMVILVVKSWEDLLTWRSLGARKKSDKSALSSQSGSFRRAGDTATWEAFSFGNVCECWREDELRAELAAPQMENPQCLRWRCALMEAWEGCCHSLLGGQVGWSALGHWKSGVACLCLWVSWLPWAPLWWTTGDCSSSQCTHYVCVLSPMSGLSFYLALKEKQGLCLTLGSLS